VEDHPKLSYLNEFKLSNI